jgi:electron transport complex protein RnfG
VSGVAVTKSGETSGLGDNAKKADFRDQFKGLSGEVKVTKDGGVIDAITGATITSRAVSAGVTSALAVAAELG